MTKKAEPGYADFIENLGHRRAQADDAGYIDHLVAAGPAEVGAPLAVSERVRRIREAKGLTPEDVASRAGLSPETIRQIEAEEQTPPLGVLIKLAKALEMRMGTLLSPARPRACVVVRADQGQEVSRKAGRSSYTYQHLAADKGERAMEPFLVILPPGHEDDETSTHDGQEFIYILEGQMMAKVGPETTILSPGDSIYYDSNIPHLVACHGDKPTRIVAVIYAEA